MNAVRVIRSPWGGYLADQFADLPSSREFEAKSWRRVPIPRAAVLAGPPFRSVLPPFCTPEFFLN